MRARSQCMEAAAAVGADIIRLQLYGAEYTVNNLGTLVPHHPGVCSISSLDSIRVNSAAARALLLQLYMFRGVAALAIYISRRFKLAMRFGAVLAKSCFSIGSEPRLTGGTCRNLVNAQVRRRIRSVDTHRALASSVAQLEAPRVRQLHVNGPGYDGGAGAGGECRPAQLPMYIRMLSCRAQQHVSKSTFVPACSMCTQCTTDLLHGVQHLSALVPENFLSLIFWTSQAASTCIQYSRRCSTLFPR